MKTETTVWGVLGGILIPIFEYFYGPDPTAITMMAALTFFLVLDWITGVRAAVKDKSYSSKYGIDGMFRSFFILLLPAGAHMIGKIYDFPNIVMGIFIGFLLLHISKSMVANAIRCGWGEWIPLKLLDVLMKWAESELDKKFERSISRGGIVSKDGEKSDTKG